MSEKLKIRTQFCVRLPVPVKYFPESVVQPGMSPSISQMIKTRSVGGQIDELEMDGIESDAPFESEYVDFFDIQDEAERLASQKKAVDTAQPQKDSPSADDIGKQEAGEK